MPTFFSKKLAETRARYSAYEDRVWKRIVNVIEMSLLVLCMVVVVAVLAVYGDGTKFQSVYMLFAVLLTLSSIILAIAFHREQSFKRWQILIITLGLGCGMGVSAIAAFVILELQLANT